ncbi:MAG: hypothetical protein AB7N90_15740, partial [Vicinamibacterales bacterium]
LAREQADRAKERAGEAREREMDLYETGQELIEESRWSDAIERFQQVIELAGPRVDAALYWKAYALDKAGERAEALAAITEIADRFPDSRWLGDAKALEIQVRRNAGQPVRPENEADEELKLLAIQSLQFREPGQAIPLLKGILDGPQSVKLKERALFVLAQSQSPEARQMLADFARGASNPDLQRKAIDYLGVHGSADNRKLLGDIYAQTDDVALKRRILRAFMVAGDRARVLAAATGEASPELRAEAVRQLGVMGADDELWQLYQKETDVDVKKRMLQAMFIGGNADRLLDLATTEQNRELRLTAVKNLGLLGRAKSGENLVAIYTRNEDPEFKRAAVQALFVQGNAEALVGLARKETNLDMKKVLVQRLSLMKDKVAVDYLMELLK